MIECPNCGADYAMMAGYEYEVVGESVISYCPDCGHAFEDTL